MGVSWVEMAGVATGDWQVIGSLRDGATPPINLLVQVIVHRIALVWFPSPCAHGALDIPFV